MRDELRFNYENGRLWYGDCAADDALCELQNITNLPMSMPLTQTDIRVRQVLKAAVLGKMPDVKPRDEAERLVFRAMWDEGRRMAEDFNEFFFDPIPCKTFGVFADNAVVAYRAKAEIYCVIETACGGKRLSSTELWDAQGGLPHNQCDVRACQVALLFASLHPNATMARPLVKRIKCDGEKAWIADEFADPVYHLACASFAQSEKTQWHVDWLARAPF